jgi:hypothetical protein
MKIIQTIPCSETGEASTATCNNEKRIMYQIRRSKLVAPPLG